MRRFVLLSGLMLGVTLAAEATIFPVTVQDFEFVPALLTVSEGDTVVWTNVQGAHNVHHACGTTLFGNAVAEAPWVYSFAFDVPAGDYPYLCEVHPDIMLGNIHVLRVPQRTNVTVQSFSFTPSAVTVQQGDTVVWTNISGTHSVHHTGNPSLFDSGNPALAPWVFSFVFNLPAASYPYVCELHPASMQGTVTVTVPAAPPPAPGDLVISVTGDNAILNWSAVTGADCYTVYRGENGADAEQPQLIGIVSATTFVQPITALPGSKYFFQVRTIGQ